VEEPLNRFFSRSALIVAASYVALIVFLLIGRWRMPDKEAGSVALSLIGLPWIFIVRHDSWLLYTIAIALNIATVYVFVLCVARVFKGDRDGSQ
jgi:hypothetical protein